MKRGLFYFILFDLLAVIFIIFYFNSNKQNSSDVENKKALPNQQKVAAINTTQNNNQNNNVIQSKAQIQPSSTVAKNSITSLNHCFTYGPLDIEQKMQLDLMLHSILAGQDYAGQINQYKSQLIEIYWNLGRNKIVAIETFEKQKNDGALKDEKFKLVQQNGEWIVPVALIANDKNIANKMIKELSQSSSNLGGTWQYQYKDDGYFYQFKNMANLPQGSVEKIDNLFINEKNACLK